MSELDKDYYKNEMKKYKMTWQENLEFAGICLWNIFAIISLAVICYWFFEYDISLWWLVLCIPYAVLILGSQPYMLARIDVLRDKMDRYNALLVLDLQHTLDLHKAKLEKELDETMEKYKLEGGY